MVVACVAALSDTADAGSNVVEGVNWKHFGPGHGAVLAATRNEETCTDVLPPLNVRLPSGGTVTFWSRPPSTNRPQFACRLPLPRMSTASGSLASPSTQPPPLLVTVVLLHVTTALAP